MSTITVGYLADGTACDYTTFSLFNAAWGVDPDMPTTLTEVINVEVWYADASQGTFFNETLSPPDITPNGFYITLTGQYGNYRDQTCPSIYGFYLATGGNLKCSYFWNNLGWDNTSGTDTYCYYDKSNALTSNFYQCYCKAHQYGLYLFWQRAYLKDCFIYAAQQALYTYTLDAVIDNCIIISGSSYAINAARGVNIKNSTLYTSATAFRFSHYGMMLTNTIVYCKQFIYSGEVSSPASYPTHFINSCIYQTDNPGKLQLTQTPEEFLTGFYHNCWNNSLLIDPEFVNAGGTTIADYALESTSPVLPTNRAVVSNEHYPAKNLKMQVIGAYSDYETPDFPAVSSVLTTDTVQGVTGTWHAATASKYKVGETYGVGGTSVTGTFSPDYPEPENVLPGDTTNGVTGTFDESSRNTDPGEANVVLNTTYKILNIAKTGSYNPSGTAPNAVVLSLSDNGDGANITVTISNSTDGATNEIFYDVYGSESWSTGGSRTGNGDVVINTGEGNFWFYCAATKDGKTSVSLIYAGIVGSTTESLIEQAMEAVRDQINAQNYTDSTDDAVAATAPTLPDFRNVNACKILVHKNMDEFTAGESASRLEEMRIFVTVCERSKTEGQITNERKLVEKIKMLFAGRRLSLLSSVYCSAATDAVDGANALKEQFLFINPIELTLETRR